MQQLGKVSTARFDPQAYGRYANEPTVTSVSPFPPFLFCFQDILLSSSASFPGHFSLVFLPLHWRKLLFRVSFVSMSKRTHGICCNPRYVDVRLCVPAVLSIVFGLLSLRMASIPRGLFSPVAGGEKIILEPSFSFNHLLDQIEQVSKHDSIKASRMVLFASFLPATKKKIEEVFPTVSADSFSDYQTWCIAKSELSRLEYLKTSQTRTERVVLILYIYILVYIALESRIWWRSSRRKVEENPKDPHFEWQSCAASLPNRGT